MISAQSHDGSKDTTLTRETRVDLPAADPGAVNTL
jgi:hypothetical protein